MMTSDIPSNDIIIQQQFFMSYFKLFPLPKVNFFLKKVINDLHLF